MKTRFVESSRNIKTGNIPVTTTEEKSCPPSCPLKNGGGCYAEYGPLMHRWAEVNAFADNWSETIAKIAALPDNQIWRHNQAGDLPGVGERIHKGKLSKLVKANEGKRGFTYTHKTTTPAQLAAIKEANKNGFTINLSANNLEHADKLLDSGAGPVCVTLPHDFGGGTWDKDTRLWKGPRKTETPNGAKVAVCPAQYKDTSCKECQLCQHQRRNVVVGFVGHGPAKRRVAA